MAFRVPFAILQLDSFFWSRLSQPKFTHGSLCNAPIYFQGFRVKAREARWIEVEGGEWQAHRGFAMTMDEKFRGAMEESARQQGITLRSWSEYRFQYQARGLVADVGVSSRETQVQRDNLSAEN
jgi:hypothetical protein